jgi:hypothetical protein
VAAGARRESEMSYLVISTVLGVIGWVNW